MVFWLFSQGDAMFKPTVTRLALLAVILLLPVLANAQAVIKVNDQVSLRFGALIQGWADAAQDATTGGYAKNLFLRRVRILIGGQITPTITFFFETDNPNLGKAPKNLGTGFITQDAWIEWKPRKEFALDAGMMFVPLCHNCVQSAATLLTLDYGSFTFLASAATQSSAGRDTGVQAKGYLADEHFEYRVGVFQGFRAAGSRNGMRAAGHVQYDFWDTEVTPFFYAGTYLGKKKVLSLGGGFDHQQDYDAYAVDSFLELPMTGGNSLTGQVNWFHYDGGSTFPTALPEQNDLHTELGYYIGSAKVLPFVRFEDQNFRASGNNGRDNKRYQVGLTWYPNGHNFNVRGAYSRVDPRVGRTTNQYTVQAQLFYY